MPLELIEDGSRGRSWLSFARGSKDLEHAADSLRYENDDDNYREAGNKFTIQENFSEKASVNKYGGKTYDSVESVQEFFRKRAEKMGSPSPASSLKSRGRQAAPKPAPANASSP